MDLDFTMVRDRNENNQGKKKGNKVGTFPSIPKNTKLAAGLQNRMIPGGTDLAIWPLYFMLFFFVPTKRPYIFSKESLNVVNLIMR